MKLIYSSITFNKGGFHDQCIYKWIWNCWEEADAVALQNDMKIIGVSKRTPDFDAEQAIKKGYDLYCVDEPI